MMKFPITILGFTWQCRVKSEQPFEFDLLSTDGMRTEWIHKYLKPEDIEQIESDYYIMKKGEYYDAVL